MQLANYYSLIQGQMLNQYNTFCDFMKAMQKDEAKAKQPHLHSQT